jgi:ribosomal-protein-alanine N-acetyltransferase
MLVMVRHLIPSKMVNDTIFETDRLCVQNLRETDLANFHEMQSNSNVMRFIKKPMTLMESRKELERFMKYYNQKDLLFRIWAVLESSTNSFVGICGVYLNEKREYEIAYRLLEKYWGNGIGSEIAKNLIYYCFNMLQYEEIVAYIGESNIGSIKIAEKLMPFDKKFYSIKDKCIENIYRLKRENWLQ